MIKTGIISCLLFMSVISGCLPLAFVGGALAGVGGYKYVEGSLAVIYQAPYERTWNASVQALEALDYTISEKLDKVTTGRIQTEGAATRRVTISLESLSPNETEATIRVGLMGDENASNVIKDKIAGILFR